MTVVGNLGLPPPLGPETSYRRVLTRLVLLSWERFKQNYTEPTNDLEDAAAIGLGTFLIATDRANIRAIKSSFNDYFSEAQARERLRVALDADPEPVLARARVDNVALIKNITDKQRQQVFDAVADLSAREPLTDRLNAILGGNRKRARLIARDQTSKIHSRLAELRHTSAGANEYYWRTSGDERVRQIHQSINGRRYAYGQATGAEGGGAPGQPVQCRCVADPIF